MIAYPSITPLVTPERHSLGNAGDILCFSNSNIDLVKMDFVFPAGHIHQPSLLCAAAASKLISVATPAMDAQRLAEFLDYRGVVIDSNVNLCSSSLTVYTHRRYANELIPLVHDMITNPEFGEEDFKIWLADKKQKLQVLWQRPSSVARNIWYRALFGDSHPLGASAIPEDSDRLQLVTVNDFFGQHYRCAPCDIILAGLIDDGLLAQFGLHFADRKNVPLGLDHLSVPLPLPSYSQRVERRIEGTQQVALRIGRILPQATPEDNTLFEHFLVLTTLLGGYFGSRLMSNLREDKGYTYGISAHVQQYRGCRVFFVVADIAADTVQAAVEEVFAEMGRLHDEPIPEEELQLVKSVLAGDAMRALDGVFERSDRYCDILEAGNALLLSDHFGQMLAEVTADDLQRVARTWLVPDQMTTALAGALPQ